MLGNIGETYLMKARGGKGGVEELNIFCITAEFTTGQ